MTHVMFYHMTGGLSATGCSVECGAAGQVHARNHQRIFNSYNFDVAPAPGSDMDKAHKLHRKREVPLSCLSTPGVTMPAPQGKQVE